MSFDLEPDFDEKSGLVSIEGISMVIHCHFYNVFLLQAIETATYVDGRAILIRSSEESVNKQLIGYYDRKGISDEKTRISIAADMFKVFGVGLLDFSNINGSGGTVTSKSSHVARGWKEQIGTREKPVDYISCGFIAGALAAVYNKPIGTFKVNETECLVQGKEKCKFEVSV